MKLMSKDDCRKIDFEPYPGRQAGFHGAITRRIDHRLDRIDRIDSITGPGEGDGSMTGATTDFQHTPVPRQSNSVHQIEDDLQTLLIDRRVYFVIPLANLRPMRRNDVEVGVHQLLMIQGVVSTEIRHVRPRLRRHREMRRGRERRENGAACGTATAPRVPPSFLSYLISYFCGKGRIFAIAAGWLVFCWTPHLFDDILMCEVFSYRRNNIA